MSAHYESRLSHVAAALPPTLKEVEVRRANEIKVTAQANAPVRRGKLKAAIHTEAADDGDGTYVVAGDGEAWYGHFSEFGTVRQPAKPFLVPATEAHFQPFVADAERSIQRVCEA